MMKKILPTIIALSFAVASLKAQNVIVDTVKTPISAKRLNTFEPGERAQSVYFEVLGAGGTYSFNYDTRFQNTLNGLGGRVGLSYIAADGNSVFSVPVMLNYLLGKNGKYFEMGIGATYIGFDADLKDNNENEVLFIDGDGFFGTMNFGYRKQPVDGGFMFRAGIAPVFGKGNFIPWWPYLSLGFSF
jgi:hypothetical protein